MLIKTFFNFKVCAHLNCKILIFQTHPLYVQGSVTLSKEALNGSCIYI